MRVFEERGITHLDLHGTKHQDVSSEVLNFTYQYQELLPLIIICGNSNKMIEVTTSCLNKAEIRTFSSHTCNVKYRVVCAHRINQTMRRAHPWRSCAPCAPGTYQSGVNASSCVACPSGRFATESGTVTCTGASCVPGKYGKLGATFNDSLTCDDCDAGRYQDMSGGSGCKTCGTTKSFGGKVNAAYECFKGVCWGQHPVQVQDGAFVLGDSGGSVSGSITWRDAFLFIFHILYFKNRV